MIMKKRAIVLLTVVVFAPTLMFGSDGSDYHNRVPRVYAAAYDGYESDTACSRTADDIMYVGQCPNCQKSLGQTRNRELFKVSSSGQCQQQSSIHTQSHGYSWQAAHKDNVMFAGGVSVLSALVCVGTFFIKSNDPKFMYTRIAVGTSAVVAGGLALRSVYQGQGVSKESDLDEA